MTSTLPIMQWYICSGWMLRKSATSTLPIM